MVSALGAVLVALLHRQNVKLNRMGAHVRQAREQVRNSHGTNLRDDLDKVIDGVGRLLLGQDRQSSEIAGLRKDLRVEREERLALTARVDAAIIARPAAPLAPPPEHPSDPA